MYNRGVKRDTTALRDRYDRLAPVYDRLDEGAEQRYWARWRQRLWERAKGPRVLEIGVGTGKNIPYYPEGVEVTAVDLSPRMLALARRRAARLGRDVDLRVMDAQRLELPDKSFDTVAATFVFGTMPDPLRGLEEARRVLRPDGRLLLLEFVRPKGAGGLIADLFTPLTALLYGDRPNRRIPDLVRCAGFEIKHQERLWRGFIRLISARPGGAVRGS